MEDFVANGHSLPIFALVPTLLATLAIMFFSFRKVRSTPALFVGWAIYIRFAAGALHDFTFKPSPVGLSYNALISLLICSSGLFIVRRRSIADASILPFTPIIILIVLSGLFNGAYAELTADFTKYAYLIILVMATVDAFQDVSPDKVFRLLLIPVTLPLFLQILSVMLHVPKVGETDGADSYIGGYNHEASFSIVLLVGILAACLIRDIRLPAKLGLLAYGVMAILLANYRTSILSVLPLVATSVLSAVPRVVVAKQRVLMVAAVIIAVSGLAVVGTMVGGDRFSDLSTASQEQEQGALIKRPETFSPTERRVLSSRPYIWSMYYYGWADAPLKQKVIGFGAGTWARVFNLYAHNTLVSALYELGVLGVMATLFMWLFMLVIAIAAQAGPRLELIAAHISFFVLNMATMPLWQIEGVIFYAILCGYTIHCFIITRKLRTSTSSSRSGCVIVASPLGRELIN